MVRLGHGRYVHFGELAGLLARLDAGEVQEVEDELAHAVQTDEAAVDHLALLRRLVLLQQLEVALDGVERGLEFVRQHRDEVEAHLPLFFGQTTRFAADDQLVGGLT